MEDSLKEAYKISLVIPTFRRFDSLRKTLTYVTTCQPSPNEILVHVDFGDDETTSLVFAEFPEVRCFTSTTRQGPGGGRNRLMAEAIHECIVSLDDDSWPANREFFGLAARALLQRDDMAAIACPILESDGDEAIERPPTPMLEKFKNCEQASLTPTGSFVGCGAVVRRSAFLQTDGYLPLRWAYGMEEVDLGLQLLDAGWRIGLATDTLLVMHACERTSHHADPQVNAAHIRNTALLSFLRYPTPFFALGVIQTLRRTFFSIQHRRFRGILTGWITIPATCWQHRHHRKPVRMQTLRQFRAIQKSHQG